MDLQGGPPSTERLAKCHVKRGNASKASEDPLVVAVAVGGPAGDLLESMVKRGVHTKDTGNWLAGAGGLLDRIDSLLLALPWRSFSADSLLRWLVGR